jgi:hypothetical protein
VHTVKELRVLWKDSKITARCPSGKDDIITGLLQARSFDHMKHLKGVFDKGEGKTVVDVTNRLNKLWYPKRSSVQGSRNMAIGSMNESVVVKRLASFLNDPNTTTELPFTIEVLSLESRGLQVGKKDRLAKVSVDVLMAYLAHTVSTESASRGPSSQSAGDHQVHTCYGEVKTRTVAATTHAREAVVRSHDGCRVFGVDLGDTDGPAKFHKLVLSQANRAQIMFIASFDAGAEVDAEADDQDGGDSRTVCFIEATVKRIMYVVFVHVPYADRKATLLGFLRPTIDRFVKPIVAALEAVDRPADSTVLRDFDVDPSIVSDEHAYALDFAKAAALDRMRMKGWNGQSESAGQPLPVMKKLVHKAVEVWNLCMNSVDILSMFVEKLTSAYTNNGLPMQIWLLCLGVLVAWAHKFFKLMNASGTGGGSAQRSKGAQRKFEGAGEFRRRCNKQSTMQEDLRLMLNVVVDVITEGEPEHSKPAEKHSRQKGGDVVLVPADPDYWNTAAGIDTRSKCKAQPTLVSSEPGVRQRCTHARCCLVCACEIDAGDLEAAGAVHGNHLPGIATERRASRYGCAYCGTAYMQQHGHDVEPGVTYLLVLCHGVRMAPRYEPSTGAADGTKGKGGLCWHEHHSVGAIKSIPCTTVQPPTRGRGAGRPSRVERRASGQHSAQVEDTEPGAGETHDGDAAEGHRLVTTRITQKAWKAMCKKSKEWLARAKDHANEGPRTHGTGGRFLPEPTRKKKKKTNAPAGHSTKAKASKAKASNHGDSDSDSDSSSSDDSSLAASPPTPTPAKNNEVRPMFGA